MLPGEFFLPWELSLADSPDLSGIHFCEVEPWSSKTRSVPAVKAVERRNETVFALESTVFRSAKYYSTIMDIFDFRPRFSPVINSIPYRFSIGAYRGKKRVVIAWFSDEEPANDYLIRCRLDYPAIRFDCLRSLL